VLPAQRPARDARFRRGGSVIASADTSPTRLVLLPEDEYCHEPDPAPNYNESMYFNVFDAVQRVGGWFRIGNRVNEGHAEMSNCIYLPDGRIAFMFGRPRITDNREMRAGGMHIEVMTPFERQRVRYEGRVCLLERPQEMADPRSAFRNNPMVPCTVDLDYRGVAPMYGGRPVLADGSEPAVDDEKSFAKAHYEQHVAASGRIRVGDESFEIDGLGLRDKSWGPRYWQAIHWYRWLPLNFGRDFAMAISVIADEEGRRKHGGMVLRDGAYVPIRETRLETTWDEDDVPSALRATVVTDDRSYALEGRVLSSIPLRNRRRRPDGSWMTTRITEGMSEFRCEGRTGYGLAEYLDQMVDGRPVGLSKADDGPRTAG